MDERDLGTRAVEMTVDIVAARLGAAAGRPNAAEGRDTAAFFRQVLAVVREGLGLLPQTAPEEGEA